MASIGDIVQTSTGELGFVKDFNEDPHLRFSVNVVEMENGKIKHFAAQNLRTILLCSEMAFDF